MMAFKPGEEPSLPPPPPVLPFRLMLERATVGREEL